MVKQINGVLTRRRDGEFLEIRPWGKNSLRVRATQRSHFDDPDYGALMECEETSAEIVASGESGKITNGKIT